MTNKLVKTPSELLNFLKDLTDNYDNLTKDEYFQCIKDYLGVFELDKPTDINITYKRIMNFVNKGFVYMPLSERPIFLCLDLDVNDVDE